MSGLDRGRIAVLLLLLAGAVLRLTLWGASPPNNTYDDHLEPIAHYATHAARPGAGDCWQCLNEN